MHRLHRSIIPLLAVAVFASAVPVGAATVLSYNVQNLFNDVDDGLEYEEFRSSSGWDRDAYFTRLARVDEVVTRARSGGRIDALVLQEVESPSVAADLTRDLLREYKHIASGEAGRTTTQVVVLTRRSPASTFAHRAVEVELVPGGRPRTAWSSRAVVDVTLSGGTLRLFASHWKSQSGGTAATAPLRLREARLIRTVVESSPPARDASVLIIGDLNEAPAPGDAPTALATLTEPIPGIEYPFRALGTEGSLPGTYYFRGAWSQLDHAYLLAAPDVSGTLAALALPFLLDRVGVPRRYDARRRVGYSDHLPILVSVTTSRSR